MRFFPHRSSTLIYSLRTRTDISVQAQFARTDADQAVRRRCICRCMLDYPVLDEES